MAGIVLTGGYRPPERDIEAIRRAGMFAFLVEHDTYAAASEVHDLLVKTHPSDSEKIELTKRLVAENLDVDRILARFAPPNVKTGNVSRRSRAGRSLIGGVSSRLRSLTGRAADSR